MVAIVDYHSSGLGYENLRGANPVGGVATMAMPQRDDPPSRCALRRTSTIDALNRRARKNPAANVMLEI